MCAFGYRRVKCGNKREASQITACKSTPAHVRTAKETDREKSRGKVDDRRRERERAG